MVKPMFYTDKERHVHRIASCGLTETLNVVAESVLVKARAKCSLVKSSFGHIVDERYSGSMSLKCDTNKCSWCDGLTISGFAGNLIEDG